MNAVRKKMDTEAVFKEYLKTAAHSFESKDKGAFSPWGWFRRNYASGSAVSFALDEFCGEDAAKNVLYVMEKEVSLSCMEGYVLNPMPKKHMWCRDRDGKWLDPTLDDAHRWQYFGVVIPDPILEAVLESKYWREYDMPGVGILDTLALMPREIREEVILKNTAQHFLFCEIDGAKYGKWRHTDVCRKKCASCIKYNNLLEASFSGG